MLHRVCKTLLEVTVSGFQEGWNRHPISTVKGNLTPIQLYHSGIIEMRKMNGYHAELNQVQQLKIRFSNEVFFKFAS